jgi:hypothetical protein
MGCEMPIETRLDEDGRLVTLTVRDPLTLDELRQNREEGAAYFASAPFMVHTLVDVRGLRTLTPGLLRLETFRNVTQPTHGLMAVVGANPTLRGVANNLMKLLNYIDVRFFASEAEARTWLGARIAADRASDESRTG